MKLLIIVFLELITLVGISQGVVSGTITDETNGETLPYVTIVVKGTNSGVVTNVYGFYSLTIDRKYVKDGKISLVYSFVGYDKIEKEIEFSKNIKLNIKLRPSLIKLKSVEIRADATIEKQRIRSTSMSATTVQTKSVKHLPTIAGETDLIKIMQLLPGVSGGGEGSTSLFVRGGDADQNLVLLDEATVYNLGHLFGFFSVFNTDAISQLTMVKGAFPSNYGGRLSSILDVRMKDGNTNKFHGSGGIGLLSSRLMLEGPIIKDKLTFVVAARRTYIDKVFATINYNLPYYFYDLNAKLNYKFSDKDRLYYSFYMGRDVLDIEESEFNKGNQGDSASTSEGSGLNFGFTLGNMTHTLRWNHIYNSKLFSNVSVILTDFDYNINGVFDENNLHINSKIFDIGAKMDFDYFRNNKNHIKYGASYISHNFKPNIIITSGDIASLLKSDDGNPMYTHEFALYALNDQEISPSFKLNYGLRFSGVGVVGKIYAGLEPRIALRYLLNDNNSFKISYSRMKQYMHRVASSSIALPTDLWYPVTKNVSPQIADQIAAGYNHLFVKHNLTFEFEIFYKKMQNLIEYREGANLILNNNYEAELLAGTGKAYGAEFLLRKERGRLNGWVSYTLSKTTRYFDELNKGKVFPAKYDRRHNISIVLNYEISKRWLFSAVWVYQTGSRFTAQIGQYLMPNSSMTGVDIVPIYTDRNAVEMAPSHRLDINFTLLPKKKGKFNGELSFGAYNIYNRAQPYRVNIVANNNGIGYKYQQPGLFGFIPSVAYNFNF
ncbi:MAG: hypothetical protein DRI86_11640 [Bacteroidetes bacterium]|nr:MAG: hypothetical protein DRI86_11640 [Bacteroidota bacterium]